MQTDAYAGFNKLYHDGRVTEAVCWAHVRRKIHDVYISTRTATAEKAMKRISESYATDEEICGLAASQRLAERRCRSKPLLISLHELLVDKNATLSRKFRSGEAFAYAMNQ